MSSSYSSYLQAIAHYRVQPGHGDRVAGLLAELTAATRTEPKNLGYEVFRDIADPLHFVILERYTDASGLAEHRETEHFQRLGFGSIIPLLASREVSSYVVSVDGQGAPTGAVKT